MAVVYKKFIGATRAYILEFQWPSTEWPSVLTMVQLSMSNAATNKISGKFPLTIFSVLRQDSPIFAALRRK